MLLQGILSLSLAAGIASAITLKVSSTGGNVTSPLMYGLMFEDMNNAGDGGIYAELIQNRAFQGSAQYPSTLSPWAAVGNATLTLQKTTVPLSTALPASVNVAAASTSTSGKIGLTNPGWWGISVKPQSYTGSFWVLGSYEGNFTVKLQSDLTNQVFVSLDIPSEAQSGTWVEHTYELNPMIAAPNSKNSFVLEFDSSAESLNFNLISLFPPTYNNRPNGLRPDLVEALKGLNPSFLRMPGGNNLEGNQFHYPWMWNNTIGPLTNRPGRPGTWGYENTDGLGLVEYLNLCTDLDMEPILAVWSGMYLDPSGIDQVVSEADLAPYVELAMNQLEFILGPVTSTYGSIRASLGYPEPWNLNYVEIGNEDCLGDGETSYVDYRFYAFFSAIQAEYPWITVISSTGDLEATGPGSATDYHIYTRPDDFVSKFGYWDNAPRTHKVLVGEYANVQGNVFGEIIGTNWTAPMIDWPMWVGAVSEAVYSLGIERNGDNMIGMCYTPLFQNLNNYEWTPDLISFSADPAQNVLSTSYHAIQLLSSARYNSTVPVKSDSDFGPAYYVAGISAPGNYTFKAAIYNATEPIPFSINFEGIQSGHVATLTVLNVDDPLGSNVLSADGTVTQAVNKKVETLTAGAGGVLSFELQNYDIAVLTT